MGLGGQTSGADLSSSLGYNFADTRVSMPRQALPGGSGSQFGMHAAQKQMEPNIALSRRMLCGKSMESMAWESWLGGPAKGLARLSAWPPMPGLCMALHLCLDCEWPLTGSHRTT